MFSLQAHETASIAFVGPAFGARPRQLRQALLVAQFVAALHARRCFGIVLLRFGRSTAPLGQSLDVEFRDDALQRQTDLIPDAHAMRWLHALAVQVNLAAVDCGGRETAGFVKARVP